MWGARCNSGNDGVSKDRDSRPVLNTGLFQRHSWWWNDGSEQREYAGVGRVGRVDSRRRVRGAACFRLWGWALECGGQWRLEVRLREAVGGFCSSWPGWYA